MWEPENHLFGKDGAPPSKRQLVWLARQSAFALMRHKFEEVGPDALDKWAQHGFRVAGSQMFARAGVSLPEIQVIGRWGSMSITRHVQEATFDPGRLQLPQDESLRTTPTEQEENIEPLVRRLNAESMSSQGALVHHTRAKFVHKPCSFEGHRPTDEWTTKCGKWHYELSSCLHHFEVDVLSVLAKFVRPPKKGPRSQAQTLPVRDEK